MTCSAIGVACTPREFETATPRAASSSRHRYPAATAGECSQRRRGAAASSAADSSQVNAASQTARPAARASGVVA